MTEGRSPRGQAEQQLERLNGELVAAKQALAESERRLSQAMLDAERAHRAKSDFLSRMSHGVRTPLNAVLGFAHLLNVDTLTAQQHDSVAQIIEAGQNLLRLMNEVLDISTIESGHLSLSLEPVAVRDAIDQAVRMMRPAAARLNIVLMAKGEGDGDTEVLADRQRLAQVLVNLISNAIKYNKPDGSVLVSWESSSGNRIRINVADTGNGIAPEEVELLFSPFERLNANQNYAQGTGLGLALSRSLAEAMGATMGVLSKVGQGSTFWLDLKRPTTGAWEKKKSSRSIEGKAPQSKAGTVLYIEDNPSNLRLVERVLEQKRPGIALLRAGEGKLGLAMARDHRPDVILLDLHLPDGPGEEVLRRLWADQTTREIPVVVLSADATQSTSQRLMAAGAKAYLTKPLDVSRLLALLDERFSQ